MKREKRESLLSLFLSLFAYSKFRYKGSFPIQKNLLQDENQTLSPEGRERVYSKSYDLLTNNLIQT